MYYAVLLLIVELLLVAHGVDNTTSASTAHVR